MNKCVNLYAVLVSLTKEVGGDVLVVFGLIKDCANIGSDVGVISLVATCKIRGMFNSAFNRLY